jgi:hypothetical protein
VNDDGRGHAAHTLRGVRPPVNPRPPWYRQTLSRQGGCACV